MSALFGAVRAAVHAMVTAVVAAIAVLPVQAAPADGPVSVTLRAPQTVDRFVDSIGMNVHLAYRTTGYANTAAVERFLTALHVRHIRDGTIGQTFLCRTYQTFARDGIRTDFLTSIDQDPRTFSAWSACVGNALEAFEGPNEFNTSGGAWASRLRAFQQRLYTTVKTTPALAAVPVIAPSLTVSDAYRAFGDATAISDIGNSHDYLIGNNPGAGGWCGSDESGRRDAWTRCALADSHTVTAAPKPVMATETGYGTGNALFAVSVDAQTKYVPRLFLEHFNAGFERAYEYELIDEGSDGYNGYGLVDASLKPKPAFTELATLLSTLTAAAGDATSPAPYPITLSAPSTAVHHTLLQNGGVFYVVLWVEKSCYNVKAHTAIDVPPEQVELQLSSIPASITIWSPASTRLVAAKAAPSTVVRLSASDWPTVVQIVPPGVHVAQSAHAPRRTVPAP